MAIASSREFRYDSFEEIIYHKTGKRVRSFRHDASSLRSFVLFYDGTEGVIENGYTLDTLEIYPVPKRMCASCGGDSHVSSFDWQGRCHTAVNNFWEKVRRVYWHRYSMNKLARS